MGYTVIYFARGTKDEEGGVYKVTDTTGGNTWWASMTTTRDEQVWTMSSNSCDNRSNDEQWWNMSSNSDERWCNDEH